MVPCGCLLIGREEFTRQRPYTVAMILSSAPTWISLLALLAYGGVALWPAATQTLAATRLLPVAWLLHAVSLVFCLVDWSAPEPLAQFGFAPSLSMMLWCVVGVYMLEHLHMASARALRVLAVLALGSVLLSLVFPGQTHPHVPHPWAPLHWVLGLTSYGLVGAALLHAALWRMAERQLRGGGPASATRQGLQLAATGLPLLKLETLTFRFVSAAFIALSLALVLGFWQANPWRWDHKAVLSVMAWVVFALLLAGRIGLGWRGRSAIRWLYAGSALLLLAYAGSRFVVEVILQRTDRLG